MRGLRKAPLGASPEFSSTRFAGLTLFLAPGFFLPLGLGLPPCPSSQQWQSEIRIGTTWVLAKAPPPKSPCTASTGPPHQGWIGPKAFLLFFALKSLCDAGTGPTRGWNQSGFIPRRVLTLVEIDWLVIGCWGPCKILQTKIKSRVFFLVVRVANATLGPWP